MKNETRSEIFSLFIFEWGVGGGTRAQGVKIRVLLNILYFGILF